MESKWHLSTTGVRCDMRTDGDWTDGVQIVKDMIDPVREITVPQPARASVSGFSNGGALDMDAQATLIAETARVLRWLDTPGVVKLWLVKYTVREGQHKGEPMSQQFYAPTRHMVKMMFHDEGYDVSKVTIDEKKE